MTCPCPCHDYGECPSERVAGQVAERDRLVALHRVRADDLGQIAAAYKAERDRALAAIARVEALVGEWEYGVRYAADIGRGDTFTVASTRQRITEVRAALAATGEGDGK